MLSLENRSVRLRSDETGSAMLVALLVLFVVVTLGISSSQVATTEVELAGNYAQSWRAFYAADGAAQASFNDLIGTARALATFPEETDLATLDRPAVNGISYRRFDLRPTAEAVEGPLTTGYYQGLVASTRPYEVAITAETDSYPPASSAITMGMFFDIIPIFQFAIFYEDDLELHPGPDMTLTGRVHSNSDIYLGAGATLTIDSNITTAGDLLNRRKENGSRPGGSVRIRDGSGGFPPMNGLDSASANWVEDSLERWRGNVRTEAHGVERLNLTISDPANPHMLIEPGYDSDTARDRTSKLFYAAEMNINILNGAAYDPDGNKLDIGTALDFDILHDQREQKDMLVVELDLAQLALAPNFPAPGEPATVYIGSFEPGNGIPDWEIVEGGGGGVGPMTFTDFVTVVEDNCLTTGNPIQCSNFDLLDDLQKIVDDLVRECSKNRPSMKKVKDMEKSGQDIIGVLKKTEPIDDPTKTALKDYIKPFKDNCDMSHLNQEIPFPGGGGEQTVSSWPEKWETYLAPYEGGDTEFAVKIENGAALANPLTIVTANPAYIQGDYNTVDKKPAAVLADAITILSNAWNDDDDTHSRRSLSDRAASNTTLNVALMLGNTETVGGNYNGGVENLPRFLETWSGRTLRYRGSLIDLWYSRNAVGAWRYGSPVYTAPVRDWEFDTDLSNPANLPPATPRVYTLRMREWSRE